MKDIFLNLFNGRDQDEKEINSQKRGYLFEELLRKLFLNEGIEVTDSFKIVGEQIDGAIIANDINIFYLLFKYSLVK